MKDFKDLKFESVPSLWDTKKFVAEEYFDNGYGIKVYKAEYVKPTKRCFEVHVIKNGQVRRKSAINKCGYDITEEDITQLMINIQQLKPTSMEAVKSIKCKKHLERLDKNKPVRFDYKVADCEHDGDMSYAEMECDNFCREFGGKVILSYWDGKDCGEAYITCEFPADKVEDILCAEFFDSDFYQL